MPPTQHFGRRANLLAKASPFRNVTRTSSTRISWRAAPLRSNRRFPRHMFLRMTARLMLRKMPSSPMESPHALLHPPAGGISNGSDGLLRIPSVFQRRRANVTGRELDILRHVLFEEVAAKHGRRPRRLRPDTHEERCGRSSAARTTRPACSDSTQESTTATTRART